LRKVADHIPARGFLSVIGVAIGVLAGFVNAHLGIDMSLSPSFLGWLLASIIVVVFLHEGLHATVAGLLGHKTSFGLRPPLVYVTFAGKLPRGHYMLVAVTPFVILNLLFGFLLARGGLDLFCDLSLIVNSIGSMGDIWVLIKLAGGPRGALIQDTKSGFEIWLADEATKTSLGIPKKV
jgi:hypothetical protein